MIKCKGEIAISSALRITLLIILGLILAIIITVSIAKLVFSHQTDREALQVLKTASERTEIIRHSDLAGLPTCVQQWLECSGVVGKERIHSVRLTQIGRMRSAEGKPWMPVQAVQYINVDQPGFVWKANVKMAPFISIVGRDMYYAGHGSMRLKLMAWLSIVDTKPGKEMDQSTLLRFLAEIAWYPTAALNDYIKWEEIDAHSARATMTWQGVTASMVFNFNDRGDLASNLASRYQEVNGQFVLRDWGGIACGYRDFYDMRLANKLDVIWKYDTGDFNWLQIEVTDLDFNQPNIY